MPECNKDGGEDEEETHDATYIPEVAFCLVGLYTRGSVNGTQGGPKQGKNLRLGCL